MTSFQFIRALVLFAAASSLISCQMVKKVAGTREIDYRAATTVPSLEVPPDLVAGPFDEGLVIPDSGSVGAATYSAYATGRPQPTAAGAKVLPEMSTVRMERAGTQRWLVVAGRPEQLWPKVREFWLKNGFLIAKENPLAGTMETDWAENRANIQSGPIQKYLAKWLDSLYSTGTRDKFRVRLERGRQPGTTEIYLSHRGMVEKVSEIYGADPVQTMWEPRPSDPQLEAEMLRLLMVDLGVEEQRAKTLAASPGKPVTARARLRTVPQGYEVLNLAEDLDRAWRRVGLSLDRVGFTVEDRDRSQWTYFVRYIDPAEGAKKKGFLSKLFKRKKRSSDAFQYRVKLERAAPGTDVSVRDMTGAPEKSRTGNRILSLLYEQLK